MKKKERLTGKNYVYEQVTFDKKKTILSTNNILNSSGLVSGDLADRLMPSQYS
jgi:hypothetical protein